MHLFTNFSVFWLSLSLMFIKWLSNVFFYMKKTIYYLMWEKKILLSWGSNPRKWDKTWRNWWQWKPGRNRIVELEIINFSWWTKTTKSHFSQKSSWNIPASSVSVLKVHRPCLQPSNSLADINYCYFWRVAQMSTMMTYMETYMET